MAEQAKKVDGVTTRDDALDSGVKMLPGDPSEPAGPEDALGSGKKRGDYSEFLDRRYTASVPNVNRDASDPNSPASVIVEQNPLVKQLGDEKGVKGGTHPLTDEV